MDLKVTFDFLPVFAVLLSLAASYLPKFKIWFDALLPKQKQLFMAASLFLIASVVSLGSWLGVLSIYPKELGFVGLVVYPAIDWCAAMIANAGFYRATNLITGPSTEQGLELARSGT